MRLTATKGTDTKKTGIILAISIFTSFDAPNSNPKLSLVAYMAMQPMTDSSMEKPYANFRTFLSFL